MDLIADIGATNTRCALVDGAGQITRAREFTNSRFADLRALLETFVSEAADGTRPVRAALAIAAPVAGDDIAMTNIGWRFQLGTLARQLGLKDLTALNDFEALAHALPRLPAGACYPVGGGTAASAQTMAVLGPGSGLGVAAAAPCGQSWVAIPGEGGHVSLPALNATEAAIVAEHADPDGHCSAERLLSGPGLVRIHASLSRLAGVSVAELTPAAITAGAAAGDAVCERTLDAFFAMLGTVAGNLALTMGARGGVFIAGGIVPRVLSRFARSRFRERFVAKGRYRAYLERIPTAVVTLEQPAFIGLKAVLGFS